MAARWLAFFVWAAVAAGTVFWGLKLFVRPEPAPAHAAVVSPGPLAGGDLSRLLGADAPDEEASEPDVVVGSRFQLIGVVAPRSPGAGAEGLALISVDGNPPRTYRVGMAIDGDQVLQSVQPRGARIGPRGGNASVSLDIPPPAAAATGTLPAAPGQPGLPAAAAPPGLPTPRVPLPGTLTRRAQPEPPVALEPQDPPQEADTGGTAALSR